ncbi:hypothetical protein CHS0354_031479 [Potamilus streckersoni]|uniref:Uncharacterized protein n=1 Tax=Potamilus streckersoni TaxID=2493646 RepID=A0AAE0SHU4_9BIVA|nr:hypothetical protein CHS0354_031479 [Potamilus streckersoni]
MAVGLLSPKIQCIVYILIFPWLLTYGLGQFTCNNEETMKIIWCGKSRLLHKCNTVTCVQRDAQSIKRGYVLWSQHCHGGKYPKYGYKDNYIWTTDCCLILAGICYQAKSVESDEDSTDNDDTSHDQATTMKTTDFEEWFTTPVDIFNSTGVVDMVEQTIPTDLEIKAEEYTETKSVMIGLYAGLPVGLFLFVAVLAVVCYVFRDKVKTVAGKFRKAHKAGLYQETYATSKPSAGNDISRTFANQEYAMHDGQEGDKSENEPRVIYEFAKSWSKPNVSFHHNPIQTEANSSCSKHRPEYEELAIGKSSNTYNTVCQAADRGQFDSSYDHIHASSVSSTEPPQGNDAGTEYDNAVI